MRHISEKIQISAVGLINVFAISQRKPCVGFKRGEVWVGGLVSLTHTGCKRVILNFSTACGRRLGYRFFLFFFYGLRSIDLPRARRVLIEASSRNKKGEVKSRRWVASSPCHPRCAAHTEKKERPGACENISRNRRARLYISSSR